MPLKMIQDYFSKSINRWYQVDHPFHFKKYELTTRVKKIFEEHVNAFDRVFHQNVTSEVIDQPSCSI